MRFVGYGRVSRVAGREGESFTSPRVQRETVERMLAGRGFVLVEWIEDLDESGGKWDRPGFQRALEMVERGEVDGVAVAKLDRFARSLIDALHAIQRIDAASGHLMSAAESFDTSTPMGRAMLQISLVFAELERSRIADNWVAQKRDAVTRGMYLGRYVPYGYRRDEAGRLHVVEPDAQHVRDLFHARVSGESWAALTARLRDHVPGRAWTPSNVRYIIDNRAYLGESRHGDLINPAAHEPIVKRPVWEAAQPNHGRVVNRSDSLLAGVLECSGCGRPMTRSSVNGVRTYVCQRHSAEGRCPRPVQINAERTDAHITSVFLEWARAADVGLDAVARNDELADALTRLDAAEAELAGYRDANLVTIIGLDAFREGLEQRAQVVDAARVQVADAQRSAELVVPRHGFSLVDDWDRMPIGVRRAEIQAVLEVTVEPASRRGSREPVEQRLLIRERRL